MARYIDADKVMEEIYRIGGHNLCEWDTLGVKDLIDRQPTANVAPIAHTVKKMQERFKAKLHNTAMEVFGHNRYYLIGEEFIDQIAKEMLEGQNDIRETL